MLQIARFPQERRMVGISLGEAVAIAIDGAILLFVAYDFL
jgi:hypothetical protein